MSLIFNIFAIMGLIEMIPLLAIGLLMVGFAVLGICVKIGAVVSSPAPGYQSGSSDQTSTELSSPDWFLTPNPTSAEIDSASDKKIHPVLFGCLLASTQKEGGK